MTFVFLQYPPVIILFLAAVLFATAGRLSHHAFLLTLLSGVSAVVMVLAGLFFSVPLPELLMLLLALTLVCGIVLQKGGKG